MREDLPGPGLGSSDPPSSFWVADAPAVPMFVVPDDWIPAVPDGVVAVFTGSGVLAALITVKPGVWPKLTGRGVLQAATITKAFTAAQLVGGGALTATVAFPARLSGTGTLTATASHPARFTGSGALSAVIVPKATAAPGLTGSGALSASVAAALSAALSGSGALSAVVIGGYPATPAFTGSGALSAVVVPKATAAAAFTGSGALAAALATYTAAAALTGSGTLSAAIAPGFTPSGMTKNGAQTWSDNGTWTLIPGWTANTGTYPGSSVVSDKLVVQGTKANATLSASVPFTGGIFNSAHQIRLVDQSNNVIGSAGSAVSANSGTCTVTVNNVNLSGITSVGVQMSAAGTNNGSVTTGTGTFLTIT
ncbi:hypothetical protein [Nocardia sp. SC052]|uniref:hypothetical protein n=1 Tax=Nocardia sichangensis TaxID=3385975 RepID=UPI0039A39918